MTPSLVMPLLLGCACDFLLHGLVQKEDHYGGDALVDPNSGDASAIESLTSD